MLKARAAVLLGVVLLVVSAASAVAAAKIDTGTYTAKIGHTTFRFRVYAHPAHHCGSRAGQHCFIAISDPTIPEPCSNGQAEHNAFSIPNGFISKAGRFSYFQPTEGTNPLISFKATFNGRHASGTLRETDVYDDGSGTLAHCDTGTVRWRATLGR